MEWLERTDTWLLSGALVALLGIGSSLLARRFGAPLLLVFLGLGVALGPEGLGFAIAPGVVYAIGALALAIILFDGGLQTRLAPLRAAIAPALWLATAGVAGTALLTAFAAMWLLDLSFAEGLLLGAVLASTDAAAVFFLLRSAGIALPKRVNGVLEIESGSNDPAAVFLTLTLCTWLALGGLGGESVDAEGGSGALVLRLALALGLGLGFGVLGGRLIALGLNRLALPEGLHPLFALAGAVAVFAATNQLGGSGFLAVYVAGLMLGQGKVRAIANVTTVMIAATWLAQGGMFLLLGLLVVPSRLLDVLGPALALAAVLMLLARPLVVAACLAPFGFAKREIGFIGWVGLRGAVGIFLATLPMLMGLPNAEVYFNVAFVVVVVSLLVQGWTLKPAARLFRVALPRRETATRRIELDLPGQLDYEIVGYRVGPTSAVLSKNAELPGWARAAMVVRDETILLPNEAGPPRAGDTAYFLAPPGEVYRLDWLFAEGQEAREAELEAFGAFSLPGDVPLGELAGFYGLPIPPRYAAHTAADMFAARFEGEVQIGDRIGLGGATLVVRRVRHGRANEIGMVFHTDSLGRLQRGALHLRERLRDPLAGFRRSR
ncbi:MAG TPA: potassium/proton antiporter [Xanthomonadaceae bacterium]|jgi:cell volume regulation protein A|nr:potassium/proton antiporter [Xanthomonadaceae bacterium]